MAFLLFNSFAEKLNIQENMLMSDTESSFVACIPRNAISVHVCTNVWHYYSQVYLVQNSAE